MSITLIILVKNLFVIAKNFCADFYVVISFWKCFALERVLKTNFVNYVLVAL